MAVASVSTITAASPTSWQDALQRGFERASQTLRGLDWFEVQQIRGTVRDGRVGEYQVVIKVGFRVLSDEELKA